MCGQTASYCHSPITKVVQRKDERVVRTTIASLLSSYMILLSFVSFTEEFPSNSLLKSETL